MNALTGILNDLLSKGVEFSIDEGTARVRAPAGVLSPETLAILRGHKDELLRVLPEHDFVSPLSVGQEGLWFIQKSDPDSVAYNVAFAIRIASDSDPGPRLRGALQDLVNRHGLLRTRFAVVDGNPRQLTRSYRAYELPEVDAESASLEPLLRGEAERPFDLETEGAFRARLFRIGPGECVLLLCIHHMACDGWAFRMLVDEWLRRFASDGQPAPRLPVRRTYPQFVAWQRTMLADRGEELRRFWLEELNGASTVLDLPMARTRPPVQTFHGATLERALPPSLAQGLRALAREHGATVSTILLAAFQILLHRSSGQNDLCVGVPVAGRNDEEHADTFGYMANQVVLRSRIDASDPPSFLAFLRATHRRMLGAMERQDYPFPWLVQDLRCVRDPSRPPLVQVLFVYQRVQLLGELATKLLDGATLDVNGARLSGIHVQTATSEFELILEVTERSEGLNLGLRYNTDLFDAAAIDAMAEQLETLLHGIVQGPGQLVARLPLLTRASRDRLLVAWNDTHVAHDRGQTLHGLFEATAARTPEATAVFFGDAAIAYAELDRRANRLARHLRGAGATRETPVAVCVDRSPQMLVSLLGVLKAGGAYVPIDPTYPPARKAVILEESGAYLLVTHRGVDAPLAGDGVLRIDLDADASSIAAEQAGPLEGSVRSDNLAYLLTTSGSTGRPKAVAIEHRNAVAMIHWALSEFSPADLRGALASTSICFDLSVFELFAPLAAGGSVVLADNALALRELPARDLVTLINTVPSAMTELVRIGAVPESVRVVNLAGEALGHELVQGVYRLPHVERVYNLYGPSETTTYSTAARLVRGDARAPSIGRPIANTRLYILDPHGEPVPVGVPGEIYVGGEGLARGYFRRPDLTAERFLDDAFGLGRLYRTGDRARFRHDGTIEFLGRIDHQIKLRGFRIELGEIEAALGKLSGVSQAVVIVHGATPRERLVAYVTAPSGEPLPDLRAALAGTLPAFMVPDVYVRLDAFPLGATGKIDRRALPPPPDAGADRGDLREPSTPVEKALAVIFCDVLGVARVGADENFFRIGGHSLLSVQVLERVRVWFGVELPLRAMFEMPTIALLAKHIDAAARVTRLAAERPAKGSDRRQNGRL